MKIRSSLWFGPMYGSFVALKLQSFILIAKNMENSYYIFTFHVPQIHGCRTTYFGWTIPLNYSPHVLFPEPWLHKCAEDWEASFSKFPRGESVTFLINSHKPGFPEAAVVQIQAWLPQDPYALFRASCDISKQSLETICNHSQYRTRYPVETTTTNFFFLI